MYSRKTVCSLSTKSMTIPDDSESTEKEGNTDRRSNELKYVGEHDADNSSNTADEGDLVDATDEERDEVDRSEL